MPNYRRNFRLGGSYFFTANLADRRLKLSTENIGLLRAAFRRVRTRHPFAIDAAVIPAGSPAYDLDPARGRCGFSPCVGA